MDQEPSQDIFQRQQTVSQPRLSRDASVPTTTTTNTTTTAPITTTDVVAETEAVGNTSDMTVTENTTTTTTTDNDNAATDAATTTNVAPMTVPPPAAAAVSESIQLVMLRRELAKAESQLVSCNQEKQAALARSCALESEMEALRKDSAAKQVELQNKHQQAQQALQQQGSITSSSSSATAALSSLQAALSAAAPASSLVDLLVGAEQAMSRNIALQERTTFLEMLAQSATESASLWQKLALQRGTSGTVQQQITAPPQHNDDSAAAAAALSVPQLPEAVKLVQTCTQVTSLLQDRAAAGAADGNWRVVVEELKGALTAVLSDHEAVLKQLASARGAVARSASFCVEATVTAQQANSRAADSTLRSQFAAGTLALKAVRSSTGGNSSSSNSAAGVQYYRSVLASILSASSSGAATRSGSQFGTTSAAAAASSSNSNNQQQQQQQQLNEVAFLRRITSEYHARCQQLEAQCKEYKSIAETCARFFGPTANQNQQLLASKSTDTVPSALLPKSAHQVVIDMWRNSALELLRVIHNVVDSNTADSSCAPATIDAAAVSAKCTALEAQVSAQTRLIQHLTSSCQQLSQLASAATWLPAVVEACIPSSSCSSSSSSNVAAGEDDDDSSAQQRQQSEELLQQVAADLAELVEHVRQEVAETSGQKFGDVTSSISAQYERQMASLENWYDERFDGQRVRHGAMVQMLRGADAAVCSILETESETADGAAGAVGDLRPASATTWDGLVTARPNVFASSSSSSSAAGRQKLWASSLIPPLMPATSTDSNNAADVSQTLQRTVETVSREFRARRTQLENRLHALMNSDQGALHAQVVGLQEQLEALEGSHAAELEQLRVENGTLREEKGELEGVRVRYDKLLADTTELHRMLAAEQQRNSVSQQPEEDAAVEDAVDESGNTDNNGDAENKEEQLYDDGQQPQQQQQIADDDEIVEEVVVVANDNNTGAGDGTVEAIENQQNDDDGDGQQEEQQHEQQEEGEQQQGEDNADGATGKSQSEEANEDEGEEGEEEEHTNANPFASTFFQL